MGDISATGKYIRVSPRKVVPVAIELRGKPLSEARRILAFSNSKAAKTILKVLNSAAANAKEKLEISEKSLVVKSVLTGKGPSLKRFQPVSRGRAHPILKRTSHITVILEQDKKSSPNEEGVRNSKTLGEVAIPSEGAPVQPPVGGGETKSKGGKPQRRLAYRTKEEAS